MMASQEIQRFFEILRADNPEPKTELYYTNPFTLLVAVVLSAQATDAGVNKATMNLFQKISTPEDVIALGEEALKDHIKTIGLYKAKAKNIMEMARRLIDVFHSQVPAARQDLESLAGVGRKSANVVLNVVFGQDTIPVDTHIFRVGNRTGLAPGKTPLEVETQLLNRVPQEFKKYAHHWLVLLGRYICKARKPECYRCLVRDQCHYEPKTPAPISLAEK